MGVFGALHRLFFCTSFVQNKVTEIVAPVLGGLEYKMTFLLQGLRGGGRSHPVYSDIHVVESPHHKLAILGLKGIKWGWGGGAALEAEFEPESVWCWSPGAHRPMAHPWHY